jgi:thiamine pyrophosphate-dependent acetolactate synthase large subunit-like protein
MAVEVAARIMPDEYGKRDQVDVNVQIDAGPVLKAIAEAQQRLALQGITEAEWREDVSGQSETEGVSAEVGSTEAGGSCRTA